MDSHRWKHGRARCIVYPPRVLGTDAAPHWRDYEYRFGGDTPEGAEILRLAEENKTLREVRDLFEKGPEALEKAVLGRIRRELLDRFRPFDIRSDEPIATAEAFVDALDRICPAQETTSPSTTSS